PSAGEKPRPGVMLLASSRRPNAAASRTQALSWSGDHVLVCAGPVQPILCLAADTGKERFKLERVWEYDRGFIGPSVWQHYIGRFRLDQFDEKKGQAEAKKTFDERHRCSLVAGPVVVPVAGTADGEKGYRVFVAAARGPAAWYADYVADCVVYE